MKKYYIIDDVWELIQIFMYHAIKKHGKHLMKDKNIQKYNKVVKSIQTIKEPRNGPKIVYNSATKKYRFAKFLYHGTQLNTVFPIHPYYNTIIEYVMLDSLDPKPQYNTKFGIDLQTKKKISKYYSTNVESVKSK